jgi:LmbE family N-acetylglucosaminyl deacetylase
MFINPTEEFQGKVLIVAPHMDDEVLACGGLIARLADKRRIHVVYATDGMKSPAPIVPWRDAITPDLGELRVRESEAAMDVLGVAAENLHFLRLPEGELRRHATELERLLLETIRGISPDHVVVPFRYDRHPDHLVINRIVTDACLDGRCPARLTEYFVYYRWRLMPQRDIRRYVKPEHLLEVDISGVAREKRASLACFETQTTRFYPWQTREILTPTLLDEECVGPEVFVRFDPGATGAAVFTGSVPWIRIVHRLEPRLQKWKYLVKSSVLRSLGRGSA